MHLGLIYDFYFYFHYGLNFYIQSLDELVGVVTIIKIYFINCNYFKLIFF